MEGVREETWSSFRSALQDLLSEASATNPPEANGGDESPYSRDELRKIVTDAVGAVLVEGDLLEKLVGRTLRSLLNSGDGLNEDLIPKEPIRQICLQALRSFSFQTFGPLLRNEIKSVVKKKLTEFGNTEEFKSILDARFRAMEQYMRGEVIPHMLKQTLEKTES